MLGALGLLLSVHIKQLENFAGTMNFVIFPMYFMSTALYPLWKLEESGAGLGVPAWPSWNPFTHAVEWIRFALYGKDPGWSPWIVLGTLLLCFGLASWGYDPQRGFGALSKRPGGSRHEGAARSSLAAASLRSPCRRVRGAAGRPLVALAQRLFWAWAAAAGLALFTAWWLQSHGWWRTLVEGDPSGISVGIVLLSVVVTGWCGRRAWRLQQQAAPAPWRMAGGLSDRARAPDIATQLLGERSHGPHETAWWFAAACIKLGCWARWSASS